MLSSPDVYDHINFNCSNSLDHIKVINNKIDRKNERINKHRKFLKDSTFKSSLDILLCHEINIKYNKLSTINHISWENIPYSVSPAGGYLPDKRINRKINQVENLIAVAKSLIEYRLNNNNNNNKLKIVEFCAGSGFVILPLAAMYPEYDFVLIDSKIKSMEIAKIRVNEANLTNVELINGMIEDYNDIFDIGIGLHACGGASDVTLDKCLEVRSCFVLAPCCIGKINLVRNRPRSRTFSSILSDNEWYSMVKAGDFGHPDYDLYNIQ
jgi:hypothetical protein